jgi:hypothetical protein
MRTLLAVVSLSNLFFFNVINALAETHSSDGVSDKHIEELMNQASRSVYEIREKIPINFTKLLQGCTNSVVSVGEIQLRAAYILGKTSVDSSLKPGQSLVVKKIEVSNVPTGLMYNVFIEAFDLRGLEIKDYPIIGIRCLASSSVNALDNIMQTATGNWPIMKNIKRHFDGMRVITE